MKAGTARGGRQARIGQRLKESAKEAGLSLGEAAKAVGVSETTVYRWWSGERAPDDEVLAKYAAAVGKPAEYFFMADERVERHVFETWVKVAEAAMAGGDVEEAVREHLTEEIGTPEERSLLASASHAIRDLISACLTQSWDSLSEAERLEVILWVVEHARRGVRPSGPPPNSAARSR